MDKIDIYNQKVLSKYKITEDEKLQILKLILDDFGMRYILNDNTKTEEAEVIFELNGRCKIYPWYSLWDSNPPLSNIKYAVDDYKISNFDNSQTDKYCRTLHEKYAGNPL